MQDIFCLGDLWPGIPQTQTYTPPPQLNISVVIGFDPSNMAYLLESISEKYLYIDFLLT